MEKTKSGKRTKSSVCSLSEYDHRDDHEKSVVSAYSIAEAKAHLSALVEQVARGEAVTLTKRGKPVACIVPAGELNLKPKLDLAALAKFRASLPRSPLSSAVMVSNKTQPMPAFAGFMVENLRLFFGLFLAMSVVTLVASIGLLKRRNWARLVFTGLMALAAIAHLAGAAMPFFMFSSFSPVPENAPADLRENAELVMKIVMGLTAVLSIVLAALFGWLVKRLLSDDIRREFRAP